MKNVVFISKVGNKLIHITKCESIPGQMRIASAKYFTMRSNLLRLLYESFVLIVS